MCQISELHVYIKEKNATAIKKLIKNKLAYIKDGKLFATDEAKDDIKFNSMFWDQRQQARKILLNSLYGALLKVVQPMTKVVY
jgi:DNA polymerase elongation subunit (family B)